MVCSRITIYYLCSYEGKHTAHARQYGILHFAGVQPNLPYLIALRKVLCHRHLLVSIRVEEHQVPGTFIRELFDFVLPPNGFLMRRQDLVAFTQTAE
jgi:hypothetical protein